VYQLIDKNGSVSEPMDADALQRLLQSGNVDPEQMVKDTVYDRILTISEAMNGLAIVNSRQPAPNAPPQPVPIVNVTSTLQPDPSILGHRIGAYLIDVLCIIPFMLLASIPFVGLVMAPLSVVYWISRDSFFGNQSLGKKALGLKVVCEDGSAFSWGKSVVRNIIFFGLLAQMIPFIGLLLVLPVMGALNLAELISVLATQKRIGDHLGKTFVVKA